MQSYRDLAKERDDLISENSMLRSIMDEVIARANKIEEENKEYEKSQNKMIEYSKFAKQQAIKEFAEKLKLEFRPYVIRDFAIVTKKIDDLLKEYGADLTDETKTICPVCGQEMDETYHGRQYCKECESKLKE